MGSVVDPSQYFFFPSYATKQINLSGRLDSEGSVFGKVMWHSNESYANSRWKVSFQAQTSSEPSQSGANMAVEYGASGAGAASTSTGASDEEPESSSSTDFSVQFKADTTESYGLSYFQSITKKLAIGGEIGYLHKQAVTAWSVGLRHADETPARGSIWTFTLGLGQFAASYTHILNQRIRLATEYGIGLTQEGWESMWGFGYYYLFTKSVFKGHINSEGKVSAILEDLSFSPLKLSLCGELDHNKKQYRFGIGMSFQL